jgi:predicted RNA polymerase sigma factor
MLRHHRPVLDTTMPSVEDEVLQRLEAGRVATAIAALPADQRRVLIMRDVQGYSGRMVADALGLSTAAMKSRLHRARAAVQQTLLGISDVVANRSRHGARGVPREFSAAGRPYARGASRPTAPH